MPFMIQEIFQKFEKAGIEIDRESFEIVFATTLSTHKNEHFLNVLTDFLSEVARVLSNTSDKAQGKEIVDALIKLDNFEEILDQYSVIRAKIKANFEKPLYLSFENLLFLAESDTAAKFWFRISQSAVFETFATVLPRINILQFFNVENKGEIKKSVYFNIKNKDEIEKFVYDLEQMEKDKKEGKKVHGKLKVIVETFMASLSQKKQSKSPKKSAIKIRTNVGDQGEKPATKTVKFNKNVAGKVFYQSGEMSPSIYSTRLHLVDDEFLMKSQEILRRSFWESRETILDILLNIEKHRHEVELGSLESFDTHYQSSLEQASAQTESLIKLRNFLLTLRDSPSDDISVIFCNTNDLNRLIDEIVSAVTRRHVDLDKVMEIIQTSQKMLEQIVSEIRNQGTNLDKINMIIHENQKSVIKILIDFLNSSKPETFQLRVEMASSNCPIGQEAALFIQRNFEDFGMALSREEQEGVQVLLSDPSLRIDFEELILACRDDQVYLNLCWERIKSTPRYTRTSLESAKKYLFNIVSEDLEGPNGVVNESLLRWYLAQPLPTSTTPIIFSPLERQMKTEEPEKVGSDMPFEKDLCIDLLNRIMAETDDYFLALEKADDAFITKVSQIWITLGNKKPSKCFSDLKLFLGLLIEDKFDDYYAEIIQSTEAKKAHLKSYLRAQKHLDGSFHELVSFYTAGNWVEFNQILELIKERPDFIQYWKILSNTQRAPEENFQEVYRTMESANIPTQYTISYQPN